MKRMNYKISTFILIYCMKPIGRNAIEREDLSYNLETRKKERISTGDDYQRILYIVDKKIQKELHADSINWGEVKSINVIRDKEKIREYSPEDYDGAIIITLKKKKRNRRIF